jgi:hypothetical protein
MHCEMHVRDGRGVINSRSQGQVRELHHDVRQQKPSNNSFNGSTFLLYNTGSFTCDPSTVKQGGGAVPCACITHTLCEEHTIRTN